MIRSSSKHPHLHSFDPCDLSILSLMLFKPASRRYGLADIEAIISNEQAIKITNFHSRTFSFTLSAVNAIYWYEPTNRLAEKEASRRALHTMRKTRDDGPPVSCASRAIEATIPEACRV